MPYEIDFRAVGDGEKGGDAIALRFGDLAGPREAQRVVVIDGGTKETGQDLVDHIKNVYRTDAVDLVVSTHPDGDHSSGLSVVVEQLRVGHLLMHKPWDHAEAIKGFFADGRITAIGLERRLEEGLQCASDLAAMARKKGIPITEPFQGISGFNNAMHILGPSLDFYRTLLPEFRPMPESSDSSKSILRPLITGAQEIVSRIQDFLHIDLLDDDADTTSAENNSSTVLLFSLDGHKLLFTGDAGKTALINAAAYASAINVPLDDLNFLQAPHHGSKRNINSKILKSIKANTAFISAPADSRKHPAKKVTNALKKHGMKVCVTRGQHLLQPYNAPQRAGWTQAPEEPFHDYIED